MVMVADFIPGPKRFLKVAGLRESALRTVMQMVIAFLMHGADACGGWRVGRDFVESSAVPAASVA